MFTNQPDGRRDPDPHLERGVILGSETEGALTDAPVFEAWTRSGDRVVAATHHGVGYRSVNEDRIAVVDTFGGVAPGVAVFVADGMGGHAGGDVAAQYLCEEFVRSACARTEQLVEEVLGVLARQIVAVVDRLPSAEFRGEVRSRVVACLKGDDPAATPFELLQSAVKAVQVLSIGVSGFPPQDLRRVAEVLRDLSLLSVPDPVELSIHRTRARLASSVPGADRPDACFVGADLRTGADGRRWLDVKQIGDCKLFVAGADGDVRFETIGESMIAEPGLEKPELTFHDLMTYSLNRNVVSNSVGGARVRLKRYRKQDMPIELHPGDAVFLYSDGVDDLFVPRELVRLRQDFGGIGFVKRLLLVSERRMMHVHRLLRAELERLAPEDTGKAYPAMHTVMNRARLDNGCYLERYADGSEGRWTKPPKCDNTAICLLEVGDGA